MLAVLGWGCPRATDQEVALTDRRRAKHTLSSGSRGRQIPGTDILVSLISVHSGWTRNSQTLYLMSVLHRVQPP